MKMKQILAQTGLTDRAVRLYISKGLVFPNVSEKYNGRRDIEFSEADAQRLRQIALLRKAGFSISEIEKMVSGDADIRAVIEEFIRIKQTQIENDSRVVELLQPMLSLKEITLGDVCDTLSEKEETTALPPEDIAPSKAERVAAILFTAFFGLFAAAAFVMPVLFIYFLITDVRFPSVKNQGIPALFFIVPWALNLVLCIGFIIGIHRRKLRTKRYFIICGGAAILSVFVLFVAWVFGSLGLMGISLSQTEDPKNYMKTDAFVTESEFYDEICAVFPAEIPESALHSADVSKYKRNGVPATTKYFYRMSFFLDPDFDIVAEWRLPENEYAAAKEKGKTEWVSQEGNWTIYFPYASQKRGSLSLADLMQLNWDNAGYFFLMFACNDQTQTVRYITSYAIDGDPEGPYFLQMNW